MAVSKVLRGKAVFARPLRDEEGAGDTRSIDGDGLAPVELADLELHESRCRARAGRSHSHRCRQLDLLVDGRGVGRRSQSSVSGCLTYGLIKDTAGAAGAKASIAIITRD